MKNLFLLSLLGILLLTSCGPRNEYRISGVIRGVDSGMAYLQKSELGEWIRLDSAPVINEKFVLTGSIVSPEMRHLAFSTEKIIVPVFLENSIIDVTVNPDSVGKFKIRGSNAHSIFMMYERKLASINRILDSLDILYDKAKEAGDKTGMTRIDTLYETVDNGKKDVLIQFIRTHSLSPVSAYLALRNAHRFDLPGLEEVIAVFDPSIDSSVYVIKLKDRVALLKSIQVGQPAPDFTQADTAGNPVSLYSFKGNVVLVDFWASWCSPCRAENPNLVEAYGKFHEKGFTILGVSLDNDTNKWLKAINDDQLTWTQVSDLKRWNNKVALQYAINLIPSNVLVDPQGIIIARNLRGEELRAKLEEIFTE